DPIQTSNLRQASPGPWIPRLLSTAQSTNIEEMRLGEGTKSPKAQAGNLFAPGGGTSDAQL
ncbi:hypothetical protein P7K49_024638, partial [Saguinus oedipus]